MKIFKKITQSESFLFKPINFLIYRFFQNNLYKINRVIKSAEIMDKNNILIELKNNDKYYFTSNNEIIPMNLKNKIKYSQSNRIDKILDYKKFFFIYDLIDEVYVNGNHFNQLNYNKFNTIIDIGANIGAFTINANRTNNKAKYILCEPDIKNIENLRNNLELNKIKSADVIEKGIWSSNGEIEFYTSNRSGEHSIIENVDKYLDKVSIDVCTLETLFNTKEIQYPVLIKMDIEGAELEVIKSSINFLTKQNNITLLIEALHKVNGKETYKEIIPLLESAGYEIIDWNKDFRGTIYAKKE